jgi:hypothetical protein
MKSVAIAGFCCENEAICSEFVRLNKNTTITAQFTLKKVFAW